MFTMKNFPKITKPIAINPRIIHWILPTFDIKIVNSLREFTLFSAAIRLIRGENTEEIVVENVINRALIWDATP